MAHSQDQIKKGRQRAILWAVLFTVVGCVAIYRGAFMEGWMSEIYLVAGVLMIVFQLFNLFYNFVMFPIALRHSVSKELKKDTSLLEPMEYAFEPDKIVCFLNGRHRSTTLCSEIFEVEKTIRRWCSRSKTARESSSQNRAGAGGPGDPRAGGSAGKIERDPQNIKKKRGLNHATA